MERFLNLPITAIHCPLCKKFHYVNPRRGYIDCPTYWSSDSANGWKLALVEIVDNKITISTDEHCRQYDCPKFTATGYFSPEDVDLDNGTVSVSFKASRQNFHYYYCGDCVMKKYNCAFYDLIWGNERLKLFTFKFDEKAFATALQSYKKDKLRATLEECLGDIFKDKNAEIGKLSEIIQETLECTGDTSYL